MSQRMQCLLLMSLLVVSANTAGAQAAAHPAPPPAAPKAEAGKLLAAACEAAASVKHPESRAILLQSIAWQQLTVGDLEGLRLTVAKLDAALSALDDDGSDEVDDLRAQTIGLHAITASASQAAKEAEGEIDPDSALQQIASVQSTSGDNAGALDSYRRVTSGYTRDKALAGFIADLAEQARFPEALQAVALLSSARAKALSLRTVRKAMLQAHQQVAALSLLEQMRALPDTEKDLREKAMVQALVAQALADSGDPGTTAAFQQAIQTATSHADAYWRMRAILDVAGYWVEAPGSHAQALAEVGKLLPQFPAESDAKRRDALYRIAAYTFLDAGEFAEALQCAGKESSQSDSGYVMEDISVAQAKAGRLQEALATARSIPATMARVQALLGIAKDIQTSDAKQALALASEAAAQSHALDKDDDQGTAAALAQTEAVKLQAGLEDYAAARSTAEACVVKEICYERMAYGMAKNGRAAEAAALAAQESGPKMRAYILLGAAVGLLAAPPPPPPPPPPAPKPASKTKPASAKH